MDAVRKFIKTVDYWWFRWCLATEMYMVEKWERVTINVLFLVLFLAFWYFNYKVILSVVSVIVQGVLAIFFSVGTAESPQIRTASETG